MAPPTRAPSRLIAVDARVSLARDGEATRTSSDFVLVS
jgi:hypothetical protein